MSIKEISGQYIDVVNKEIYPAKITIEKGLISRIEKLNSAPSLFLSPGLTDAHIHIESSMVCPSRFAFEAVKHGTLNTVSDPHEIANVCGIEGINFMIDDGKKVPFNFHFGAPSCVPATDFETSGARIDSEQIRELLKNENIHYLSEMMNYPGVIYEDKEVLKKIQYSKDLGKPIDGHAPGLRGENLKKYVSQGISTDHECFTYEEAKEKIHLGMKILIREGSAAKNYEALKNIISEHPESVMFCSDDKHPDDLLKGHINQLIARGLKDGFDFWDIIRASTLNPNLHYGLSSGLIQVGDQANIVAFKNIKDFKVDSVWFKGELIYENAKVLFELPEINDLNNFLAYKLNKEDFNVELKSNKLRVIEAFDGELVTGTYEYEIKGRPEDFESDIENDILKICVVNRYEKCKPSVAWIKNFGLKRGAIASTVAHDCHNIIAVGCSNEAIEQVVNELMKLKGGIAIFDNNGLSTMPLEIGGLMSKLTADEVGSQYEKLDAKVKSLGSKLRSPFMTLSFMALLVIPKLKLSDKGLFNGEDFKFVPQEL